MTDTTTTTRRAPAAASASLAASAPSDGSRCPVVGNAGILGVSTVSAAPAASDAPGVLGPLRVRSAFGA